MRKVNQFKTLIIEEVDHTTSDDAPAEHGHNFYEIIYVESGEGTHFIEIAAHFNISPNYFSTFFKKNFGMAYLEYVHNYKIGLIEKRITSGQASFKQIAEEFRFADESHLTKFFRQMKNINPADYRKNLKVS